MALKATVDTLEGIDEAFHPLYEKNGEGFVLVGIDDKDYKSKLDEFRNNNIRYLQQ